MRTDVHTHVFHPKIAPKVLARLEGHYAISPVGTGLAEDLMSHLDRAGLDRAVVHTAATDASQVIPANNWAISLQKNHPGRILAFGTIHPDFGDPETELDRIRAKGIRGLKLHPDFQGFSMDDPALFRLLEMAGDRFHLMFHVGDRPPPDQNPSCPRKLATLRRMFPGPVMIAAHMGGYLHWQWVLEHLGGENVYFDTSSTLDFVETGLLRELFNGHPAERILFGSDYPLFSPEEEAEKLGKRLGLPEDEMDRLMSNADAFLDS